MKFELNEYHKNLSDEDLIDDVRNTATKLHKATLTGEEYSQNGTYHSSTLTRRFGSWKKVLEKSGLETKGHSFTLTFTDKDIVSDLKRVADIYQSESLTAKEYDKYGNYCSSTLIKHYGTWNAILKLARMKLKLNRNVSDEEMFKEISRIWIILGRQPTTTDIRNGISTYSLQSYARRFGGWRGALQAFINCINAEAPEIQHLDKIDAMQSFSITNENSNDIKIKHKTRRDVGYKLRHIVMTRDNFKCCHCGASPANSPGVILHIDHIIPWSKGGETTIDNLQTLCNKCNLGKSDLL